MHNAPATTAAQILRRFPRAIWNQLTGLDARLLDVLAYLSRLQAKRSPTGARYCVPGRTWLAAHLDCSTTSISRHTSKLRDLGLLSKRQRRPVAGTWQTCLYSLNHPTTWQFAALRSKIEQISNRLSKKSALASSSTSKTVTKPMKESLRDVIQRGYAKFAPT